MAIQTICPNPACGKPYQVTEDTVGRKARCQACDTRFVIRAGQGELISLARDDDSVAGASGAGAFSASARSAAAGRTFTIEESVPADWLVGDVILDLYEVTGILGEGGFGKVYQVHIRTGTKTWRSRARAKPSWSRKGRWKTLSGSARPGSTWACTRRL
jgi:hypothetical protein